MLRQAANSAPTVLPKTATQPVSNPNIDKDDMIIMGDFNLHFNDSQVPLEYQPWIQWLKNFINYLKQHNSIPTPTPTFSRGDSRTTIDCMFIHKGAKRRTRKTQNSFLPSAWTDHKLMSINIEIAQNITIGPSTWRLNPVITENVTFSTVTSGNTHSTPNIKFRMSIN
jgi:hypothetical protein